MASRIDAYLRACAARVDRALNRFLTAAGSRPAALYEAIRYSVLSGGKRIRPAVVFAVARAFGGGERRAEPAACAVELVHAYSLVHDDLPCMDDAAERRGKPSVHVRFGEAEAVLVGDALQALAFEAAGGARPPELGGRLALELARWSGCRGLVGGQSLDLLDRVPGGTDRLELVREIHLRKTAALFICSSRMGAMSAGCRNGKELRRAEAYGRALGLLFQAVDDLLDREEERDKLTLPNVLGPRKTLKEARRLAGIARRAAGGDARLVGLADFVLDRAERSMAGLPEAVVKG